MKYLNILLVIILLSITTINSTKNIPKKAIVIGATSGMGRQISKILVDKNYKVGAAGRRIKLLESLKKETNNKVIIKQIDVIKYEECPIKIIELIKELGGLDLIIITIGGWTHHAQTNLEYNKHLIKVDALGFFTVANTAIDFFKTQKHGHIVGISSIDGIRGNSNYPVYSAVKAFVSRYLEGIRNYMIQNKIPITVTEIIPGWVDNETFQFSQTPGTYWVASTKKAATQIVEAVEKKKKKVYITKRWAIIAKILQWLPDIIYNASWWKIRAVEN